MSRDRETDADIYARGVALDGTSGWNAAEWSSGLAGDEGDHGNCLSTSTTA